jgi:hypothetical protein
VYLVVLFTLLLDGTEEAVGERSKPGIENTHDHHLVQRGGLGKFHLESEPSGSDVD